MKLYRKISSYIIHPKYEEESFSHDVTVLHMLKNLPFGENIKRVMISRRFPQDKVLTIAGWGTIKETPNVVKATRLKEVQQTLMSTKDCIKAYEKVINEESDDGMLCAKNNINNRPARGDSGSALVTKDGTQVGLVSFRPEVTPHIIVYTNVTHYYQWISSTAKRLFCHG